MIRLFAVDADGRLSLTAAPDRAHLPHHLPAGLRWIDLEGGGEAIRAWVEAKTGLTLPSAEQRAEIEHSSRYYSVAGADVLILPVMIQPEDATPALTSLTLVRGDRLLLSYREATIPALAGVIAQHATHASPALPADQTGVDGVLLSIVEALVDAAADMVEGVADRMTDLSREVFRPDSGSVSAMKRWGAPDLEQAIRDLGHLDEMLSLSGQQLTAMTRAIAFLDLRLKETGRTGDLRRRLRTQGRDIASIAEQASALGNKAAFLLDATLGMINLGQTKVLNVFSVLATVFLPPTLIASIYGMNFEIMPELSWPWGYPMALAAMAVSALLPLWLIKRKGWL